MKNSFYFVFLFIVVLGMVSCTDQEHPKVDKEKSPEEFKYFEPGEFLFVGMYYGNEAIYKYNINKKKYTVFWYDTKEKVILLLYKTEEQPAYFITARKIGKRGGFPLVAKIKIYRIDPQTGEKILINSLGDAIQITASWVDDNNIEVIYTAIDKTISSYINKYKLRYNYFGKMIDNEFDTFDITKVGFPSLLPKREPTVSPSGKYGVSVLNDSLWLKIAGSDTLKFIDTLKFAFNKVKWNYDETMLIASCRNSEVNAKENAELLVYNIKGDSVSIKWVGSGLMNFITIKDLLIFDEGIANKSAIYIYSLKKNEMYDDIKIYGGCGLINVFKSN